MYLDNIMNKKWQNIFYGSMIAISFLIMISGIVFLVANNQASETEFNKSFNQSIGFGTSLPIFLIAGGSLGIVSGGYVIYSLFSNNLQVKKSSNTAQVFTIALIVMLVGYALYEIIDNYNRYSYYYKLDGGTESTVRFVISHQGVANPIPHKGTTNTEIINVVNRFFKSFDTRYIAAWIGIVGSGLAIIPIGIYIRRSNSFWR